MKSTVNSIRPELKTVYHLTDSQAALAVEIENNLNTERGYKAYYELYKSIVDNNSDKAILYDEAANFAWDDKLEEAFNRLAIEDGRPDLI